MRWHAPWRPPATSCNGKGLFMRTRPVGVSGENASGCGSPEPLLSRPMVHLKRAAKAAHALLGNFAGILVKPDFDRCLNAPDHTSLAIPKIYST
jgi:hypothetical protein